MYINLKQSILLLGISLYSVLGFAQDKEDATLETERVVIVKAYTPTISDAFKEKAIPKIADTIREQKKELAYTIFSVPVASTFTPEKGRAAAVDKEKKAKLYDNYASLGFGNYATLATEFYSTLPLNRTDNLGAYFYHRSSQGGIDEPILDDAFQNTSLDLDYTSRNREVTYDMTLGLAYQMYNWYGIPQEPILTPLIVDGINPKQQYYGGNIGGKVLFNDSYLKEIKAKYHYFGDAFSSVSHHVTVQPTVAFEVSDELVTTTLAIDYLTGSFERDIDPIAQIPNAYSILNFGISPSVVILRDDLTLNLGASVYYSMDTEFNDNDLFLYPQVTASYRLLEEQVIAFGGLEGGLKQNTYRDAVQENPFVSPTLRLTPTHQQVHTYVGLKGMIANVMSYTIKGSFDRENDKPLFRANFREAAPQEGYDYGNAFTYIYDDMKTLSGHVALRFDVNTKFAFGATFEYFKYETENEVEAWNLPEAKAAITMDYHITDKWDVGMKLFYIGERSDINTSFAVPLSVAPLPVTVLDSYIDLNIHIGYQFTDRWSAFLKGSNLTGEHYERWANFPVQGAQVLGGVMYKFDF